MTIAAWHAILDRGCDTLKLALTTNQKQDLLDYIALLEKWNKAYNLTAVRDPMEMISRHLLDSLAILPVIQDKTVLDVGTGGGLPGIPLAIANPALTVTLLDSNSKKTRFLQQAKAELALDNVMVVHGRVEQIDVEQKFDTVTARAFASIVKVVDLAGRHCKPGGCLLLMMGQVPSDIERQTLADFEIVELDALRVPNTAGARHIVKLMRRDRF